MRSCENYAIQLTLYVDGELDGEERQAVEAHLRVCPPCRASVSREQRFLRALRRSGPLYAADQGLRERATARVRDACRRYAPPPVGRSEARERPWLARVRRAGRHHLSAVAVAVLSVGAGLWGLGLALQIGPSVSLAAMAVDAHQRHERGQLPLELISQVPAEISRWFDGKVPFALQLPNYQEASGQEKRYRLEGARLVGFNGEYAAYVSYQMDEHTISLLVTARALASPSGRQTISSRGIDFHYDTLAGLKVITWSHRELTYALVSDLDERGQRSCLVCHQGAQDQDFISDLSMPGAAEFYRFER